jgi:ABC-2 type transport system permease protein
MKKYLSFFRIHFQTGIQYRLAAYAGLIAQFGWGFLKLLIYAAFYRANPSAFPMTFQQLSSYIWLQQAFTALLGIWFVEWDIFYFITNGNVSYELCRPLSVYNMWFARNSANRSARTVLRCMPILVVAFFLPDSYRLSLPASPTSAMLFVISIMLGFLMVVAFTMLLYAITFFTLSIGGIHLVVMAMVKFFTGSVIPLPFLPDRLQQIFELLPFASMLNTPFLIYGGHIAGTEAISRILLQFFWLAMFILIGKALMEKAMQRIVIHGG